MKTMIVLSRILTAAGILAYSAIPAQAAKVDLTPAPGAYSAPAPVDAQAGLLTALAVPSLPAPATGAPLAPEAVSITINDPTVTEGNSGTQSMTFNVEAGTGVGNGVTVNYAIAGVTATSGVDFTATNMAGTLQFTSNNQTRTVTVQVVGDLIDEDNETLTVTLSSSDPNVTFTKSVGTGTIIDNDTAQVSIADASITEALADLSFAVTLSITSTKVITVPYSTQNVTATAGQDYTAVSGSLVFQPGQRNKTITVAILDDQVDEGTETFQVNLGDVVNAGKADGQAIGTINDNDVASLNVMPASLSLTEGAPAATTVQINLGSVPTNPVRVTIQPSAQLSVNRTVITLTNTTTENVLASALNDTTPECDQTGQLTITTSSTDPKYNNLSKTIPATILDNDTKCITISDLSITEGDTGSKVVTFIITGTGLIAASVNYTITAVTASTPADFTASPFNGTLSFAQADTTKQVQATVFGDRIDEINETFKVVLGNGTNVTFLKREGIATIVDDDTSRVSFDSTPVTVNELDPADPEPTAYFTVTLDILNALPVTVTYNTSNGTATGSDYYAVSNGTVTIQPLTKSATIPIKIKNDNLIEGDETFTVSLSNPVNAVLGTPTQATATIIDDDKAAILVDTEVTTGITEGQIITATFSVWLESQPNNSVTVNLQNIDPQTQVTLAPTSLSFSTSNYATPQKVVVTVVDDAIAEGPHTATIRLTASSNDRNYNGSTKIVTTPITDNDTAGVLITQFGTLLNESLASFTITYTIRLTSQPTSTVTITPVTPLTDPDFTLSPTSLTFGSTGQNAWNIPQTVTVSVVDDQIDEDTETLPLVHTVSSQARFYNSSLVVPHGSLSIIDNDTAGLLFLYGTQLVTSESGATQSFSVTLNTKPLNTVTLEISSLDTTEGIILEPYTWVLTFTAANWNQPQRVTVLGVDDFIDDFDVTYSVSVRSVSPDGKYMGLTGTLLFKNLDNDGPTLSIHDASAREDIGIMEFMVELSAPTDQDVHFYFETQDITARAGLDYYPASGIGTIFKGNKFGYVEVVLLNDTLGDFDEKFRVVISQPTADSVIVKGIGIGTIVNDGDIGYIYLPAIQKTEVKFADYFDTALGWSVVPEAGASTAILNGQYLIRHTMPNRNVRSVAPVSSAVLGNVYAIETYAQVTPGAMPSTRYGLLFDWIDALRFYRFLINPVTQEYWLYIFNNGWTVLQSGTSPAIASTGSNQLRLERRNANIRAYVNNTLLVNTNNNIFQGGRVGLTILAPPIEEGMCDGSIPGCTVYAEAAFDSFFVYGISP